MEFQTNFPTKAKMGTKIKHWYILDNLHFMLEVLH